MIRVKGEVAINYGLAAATRRQQQEQYEEQLLIHVEQDAARILHLSRRTLQRYRKDGCGPKFVRRGKRFVGYTDQALTDWISQNSYASTAAECAMAKERVSHGSVGPHQGG